MGMFFSKVKVGELYSVFFMYSVVTPPPPPIPETVRESQGAEEADEEDAQLIIEQVSFFLGGGVELGFVFLVIECLPFPP